MIVVRPIKASDYEALYQIAEDSGHGFTSLPVNEEILKTKIERSEISFATEVKEPGNEGYLFVMMDFQELENPIIHVRAWQPKPFSNGTVVGLGDFKIIN